MAHDAPLLVGGRSIVVNDDGCAVDDLSFCGAVTVTVPADTPWDDLVATAVARDWVGLEALSGLPGTVGEVVAEAGSAYGQRVADTVASVRTWDREADQQRTFAAVDCGFRPEGSRFTDTDRFELRDVSFLLRQGDLTAPVRDAALAGMLGIAPGERVPLAEVRTTLLGRP